MEYELLIVGLFFNGILVIRENKLLPISLDIVLNVIANLKNDKITSK